MKISFQAKIAKMGNNRAIWIPKSYHDEIKDFTKTQFKIVIKSKKSKIAFIAKISKMGDNRIITIPLFMRNVVEKISSEKSYITITDNF